MGTADEPDNEVIAYLEDNISPPGERGKFTFYRLWRSILFWTREGISERLRWWHARYNPWTRAAQLERERDYYKARAYQAEGECERRLKVLREAASEFFPPGGTPSE